MDRNDNKTDLASQMEDALSEETFSVEPPIQSARRKERDAHARSERKRARDASAASRSLGHDVPVHSIADDFDDSILADDEVSEQARANGAIVAKKRKISKSESKALADSEIDFDVPGLDAPKPKKAPTEDPLKNARKADRSKPVMALDLDEDIAEIKAKEQGYNRGPFPKSLAVPDLDALEKASESTGSEPGPLPMPAINGSNDNVTPSKTSDSQSTASSDNTKNATSGLSLPAPTVHDTSDAAPQSDEEPSVEYEDRDAEKDAFAFDDTGQDADNAPADSTADNTGTQTNDDPDNPLSKEEQDLLTAAFSSKVEKDEEESQKPALLSDNDKIEYDEVTGAIKGWKLIHDSGNNLTGPGEYDNIPFDLDSALSDAIDRGASDLHMYPDRPLGLRINGDIYWFHRYEQLTADFTEEMSQDDSIISNIIEEKYNVDRNADMAYTVMSGPHRGERFRAHWGESLGERYAVYRHINPTIYTPEQIDLEDDILKWGWLDQGLVLVTGPTGSGKSATLACILRQVQLQRSVKICTLEEPVETLYPTNGLGLVQQREIPEDSETFADGIRAAMREDPDILLVGEIRDRETLDAAFQACNTGHLTFATLHANSTADIVGRIFSWFDASEVGRIRDELAQNLKGALAQRLIKNATGDGRVAVREILRMDENIKNMIRNDNVDGIKDYLHEKWDDIGSQGINLMLEHKTTLKNIIHLLPDGSKERKEFIERIKSLSKEDRKKIIKE